MYQEKRQLIHSYKQSKINTNLELQEDLKLGPKADRQCRDFYMLFIFIAFGVFLFHTGGIIFDKNPNPQKLLAPFDSQGNQCGFTDKENSFLFFLGQDISKKKTVCVKECPKQGQVFGENECAKNGKIQDCSQIQTYDSVQLKYANICIPVDNHYYRFIKQAIDSGFLQDTLHDIKQIMPICKIIAFAALGFSIIFMFITKYFTGIMTWMMIFLVFIGSILGGLICILKQKEWNELDGESNQEYSLSILGHVLLFFGLIWLISIAFMHKKIRTSIAVTKAAASFTKGVSTVVIAPLISFVLTFGLVIGLGYIGIHILSLGEVKFNENSIFGILVWDKSMRNYLILFLFGFFWLYELVIGISSFIVYQSSILWYYSHSKLQQQEGYGSPVFTSIYNIFRYHFGSLLLGSFLLAIFETISVIFNSMYQNLKKSMINSESNPLAKCTLKCLNCLFLVFERFIKYVSYMAYIMIGITGENFFKSAQKGFEIGTKLQFLISQGISMVTFLIGNICISVMGGLLGYYLLGTYQNELQLSNTVVPILVFSLISFIVGYLFMKVFNMAGDSIMTCIIVDSQMNNGIPQSIPHHLQNFYEEYM